MEMYVNQQNKIVELWLTNDEQQDQVLMRSLHAQYQQYKEKKYKVAVFCSGSRELANVTEDLLLHNRTVVARKDLEREQGMGMTMGM